MGKVRLISSRPDPLSQKDFVEHVAQGMKGAWYNIFLMTGRLDSEVKPEYITTSAMCFSLADKIGRVRGGQGFLVRAEHDVAKLCRAALLCLGARRVDVGLLGVRRGRVDISISQDINGIPIPCAIIENKSYVNLKVSSGSDVELYGSDWRKVCEDIKRNIDILQSEVGEIVSNTASTFYVSSSNLVLKADGEQFLARLKEVVTACLFRDFGGRVNGFFVSTDVFEIESNLYGSREEAERSDEEGGCPEYIISGSWFLAGVVIAISR